MQSNHLLSVDNPGRGDCGLYAFANSLIEIIQENPESKEANYIIQQLVNYGLDTNQSQKQNLKVLKNALLNTSFITQLHSTIKVKFQIDHDVKIPEGGYTLDEYLVKRLRVIATESFFNAYQDKLEQGKEKALLYGSKKNEAVKDLSENHKILLQYMKQKAVNEMLDNKEDRSPNEEKRYQNAKLAKEEKYRADFDKLAPDEKKKYKNRSDYIKKKLDADIMSLEDAQCNLDLAITRQVNRFKKQLEWDFPDKKQDLAFLRCYAEEHITDELLTSEGTFNSINTCYGSFLFFGKTLELIDTLKKLPPPEEEKEDSTKVENRRQINTKTGENNVVQSLRNVLMVKEAWTYFREVKKDNIRNEKGIFFHIKDGDLLKQIETFWEGSASKLEDEAAEALFVKTFFLEETNSKAIKKALNVLKQSAYDTFFPVWMDDISLSNMSEVFNVNFVLDKEPKTTNDACKKIITLKNQSNCHWLSVHSPNSRAYARYVSLEKRKKYTTKIPLKNNPSDKDIKQLIIATLNAYMKSDAYVRFFRICGRHHMDFASDLLQVINNENDIQRIKSYITAVCNRMTKGEMLKHHHVFYQYSFDTINKSGDFYGCMTSLLDRMGDFSYNVTDTVYHELCSNMCKTREEREKKLQSVNREKSKISKKLTL